MITQLEPGPFKKVTGLTVTDFSLLVSLGLFNSALMNDAVYKFKRYEDSSLSYTVINKHEGEDIGLYDTVITRKDAQKVFEFIRVLPRTTGLDTQGHTESRGWLGAGGCFSYLDDSS